jgi:hypothetical protein
MEALGLDNIFGEAEIDNLFMDDTEETSTEETVEVAKKEAIDNLGDAITKLKERKANLMAEYDGVKNEIKKNSQVDADGDIMSAIYEYASGGAYEAVGLYAALKGYDAVIKDHGNGGPNSFYILLNRSKLVVNKKYNVVK